MIPDTPLRSEGERETSTNEAEEDNNVTISKKELTRLLKLLSASLDGRVNEIAPNVSPLVVGPTKSAPLGVLRAALSVGYLVRTAWPKRPEGFDQKLQKWLYPCI